MIKIESDYDGSRGTVETQIGTAVVETPKRLYNPVTGQYQRMDRLSEDGYCRRFLAMLYAQTGGCNRVNLNSSPVATFDKDKWRVEETDGTHVLVKREADSRFDELMLGETDGDTDE